MRRVIGCGLLLLIAALPAPAQARTGLTIGFASDADLTGDTPAVRAVWIRRAVSEGAGIVRLNIFWNRVAPEQRPAGFNPSNPSSPGYEWTPVDAPIRDLTRAGLRVMITILMAPTWAEGPGLPSYVYPGTWEPSASQFASFAAAAARRYSGHFRDPLHPRSSLPAVRLWQAWNEPNLGLYLAPQWTRTRNGYRAASPGIYRRLLNSFYRAVKRVSKSNFVVSAGTAPNGDPPGVDPPGTDRMAPLRFDRALFCEKNNAKLTPTSCPDPPHLDALSHHPYSSQGPISHALNADDAAVPDMYKFNHVLRAARREHHVLPAGPKQLWVDEFAWNSDPPDPQGIPINKQARWLEQALYVLWRQGVHTVLWLRIVDASTAPNYTYDNKSGLYYLNDSPKPAATAFRFPFVIRRTHHQSIQAWGCAPHGGRLRIEVRHGRHWRTLRTLRLRKHQVFLTTLQLRGKATLRARIGSQTSISWHESRA
jgi:hypothetical protein